MCVWCGVVWCVCKPQHQYVLGQKSGGGGAVIFFFFPAVIVWGGGGGVGGNTHTTKATTHKQDSQQQDTSKILRPPALKMRKHNLQKAISTEKVVLVFMSKH